MTDRSGSAPKAGVVAIIPARGGSKGIPGKNLRVVAGVPLVAHAIRAARGAKYVTRVVVTTDDESIAAAAVAEKAEVIHRPAAISGDTASSESALLHALEHLAATEGYRPELLVFLQCTSPLTLPLDIDAAVEALLQKQADVAFTVAPFHRFVWAETSSGEATGLNHDKAHRPRRQDRRPEFVENGAVYVMKVGPFLEKKHRFFGKTVMSVMPVDRSLDIDEPADLEAAGELLSRRMSGTLSQRLAARPVRALVMDFDGVMTDNTVAVNSAGAEAVVCSRSDGLGLSLLKACPVKIAVISTEQNPVVSARCAKLGVECIQGVDHKEIVFKQWCGQNGLLPEQVLFIGNDINDLACIEIAGIACIPCDAHPKVRIENAIQLQQRGGRGVIREVCDALVEHFDLMKGGGARTDQEA